MFGTRSTICRFGWRRLLFAADGTHPTVTVEGVDQSVLYGDDCVSLENGGELCSEIYVEMEENAYGPGSYQIQVTNQDPSQCSSGTETFDIFAAPTLTDIAPLGVCLSNSDQMMTLNGTTFWGT